MESKAGLLLQRLTSLSGIAGESFIMKAPKGYRPRNSQAKGPLRRKHSGEKTLAVSPKEARRFL